MNRLVTRTISIPTNGVRLHAETAGPSDGPLVILLHGFPEHWAGFAKQIGPLARSGFFVVAPDQRGYNTSDKPQAVSSYRVSTLAEDVVGIIEHFGHEKAFVVGHDWGAAVAWQVAIHHPERVERLVILNVPHPAALARAIKARTWQQALRSWYIYFFQIPKLPEFMLSAGGYAGLRRSMRASSAPGTFSRRDLDRYTEAWSRPGALTGMLNWYRAAVRGAILDGEANYMAQASQRVRMPTLILWGERDVALVPQLAPWSLEWCDQGQLVRFPEASHWVQHEAAERVTSRILDFFQK